MPTFRPTTALAFWQMPISPLLKPESPSASPSNVVDLTVGVVSDTELRRRAANGDQAAVAELARRGSMLVEAA